MIDVYIYTDEKALRFRIENFAINQKRIFFCFKAKLLF